MKKGTSKESTKASTKMAMSQTLGTSDARPDAPKGPDRPPRIPMNAGKNLDVPPHYLDLTKFAYRFFAQNQIKGGRIEAAKAAWWEHVADDRGQNIQRYSSGDIMYLMKLELKYWKEDQELKREKVRATMTKQASIGEGEYAPSLDGRPEGGTSAVTHR